MLREGLVGGVIAYAAVAGTLAVDHVLAGRSPFHTAAVLGGALFYATPGSTAGALGPGPVFAFNGLHLLACLGLGVVAAALAWLADRGPHLWYPAVLLYLLAAFHLLGLAFLLSPRVRADAALGGSALVAGVLASMLVAAYLVATHRRLRLDLVRFAARDADLRDRPIVRVGP